MEAKPIGDWFYQMDPQTLGWILLFLVNIILAIIVMRTFRKRG